jgi:hypothetical protein
MLSNSRKAENVVTFLFPSDRHPLQPSFHHEAEHALVQRSPLRFQNGLLFGVDSERQGTSQSLARAASERARHG